MSKMSFDDNITVDGRISVQPMEDICDRANGTSDSRSQILEDAQNSRVSYTHKWNGTRGTSVNHTSINKKRLG